MYKHFYFTFISWSAILFESHQSPYLLKTPCHLKFLHVCMCVYLKLCFYTCTYMFCMFAWNVYWAVLLYRKIYKIYCTKQMNINVVVLYKTMRYIYIYISSKKLIIKMQTPIRIFNKNSAFLLKFPFTSIVSYQCQISCSSMWKYWS